MRPAFSTARANPAFSERKPYPTTHVRNYIVIASFCPYQDGSSALHAAEQF
jgi:hypothetical protein